MAFFKYTTFWQDSSNQLGWSENWWVSAADYDAAIVKVNNYPVTRLQLAMNYISLLGQRLCDVDSPRDSLYFDPSPPLAPNAGAFDPTTDPPAGAFDVLLCRRDSDLNNVIGHLFMHAVPLGIFAGAKYPASVLPAGWATAFGDFVTLVTNGNFLIRQKTVGGYGYVVCSVFKGLRKSSHRVGRPFGGPVGRRSIA